jgi:hypothetical protein
MSFISLPIYSWQETRDSSYRKAPLDGTHRDFLINPNRISELITGGDNTIGVPTAWFKFFDNFLNRREGPSYVKAYIAKSTIITAADTALHSTMVTLPIHKDNNPDKATVDTTIPCSAIAYVDRYNQDDEHCWIIFYNAAFKRREVLCSYTFEQVELLINHGTLTTAEQ